MDTVTLPFESARERILQAIKKNQVTIILGRTGSGKTTQIPQLLLDNGLVGPNEMIACTQPRTLAAVGVATRVADERKQDVGKEVGYQIRFAREISINTRLKFMTCGILLREMLRDPLLSSYGCVIVDEAHERNVFTDLLLGYLRIVCQKRPTFKMIVMSATLDWRTLEHFFGATTVRIPVPIFPVEIMYKPVAEKDLLDQLAIDIPALHREMRGVQNDILVFLPGEWEIHTLVERLTSQSIPGLRVFPLYGLLSPSQQKEALRYAGERKVIIATNIAESSLTLGKVMVLDSGLAKIPCLDGLTGIESLELVKISQSSAEQRTGRAGRVAPGKCIRYYSEDDFLRRPRYDQPEAERSDLISLVLMIKSLDLCSEGIILPCDPPSVLLTAAEQKLKEYGALDDNGMITPYGRQMAELPVEPILAHFILQNRELSYECLKVIVTMAAMLSVGRFFVHDPYQEQAIEKAKQKFMTRSSDFLSLFKLWKAYAKADYSEDWCTAHYLNPHWMRSARLIRVQLLRWVSHRVGRKPYRGERESISDAVVKGFFAHLLQYHRSGEYRMMSTKIPVSLARDSALATHLPEYAVCYKLRRTTTARVFAECSQTVQGERLKRWQLGDVVKPMSIAPDHDVPQMLRMTGTLRMERGNQSRMIHLDIDLERSQSTIVQCIDQGSLILDDDRYPIALLNLSSDARARLYAEHINTLGILLRSKSAFLANYTIAPHIRGEVETLLTDLGYIPRKEDIKPAPAVQKPVEKHAVSIAIDNDDDGSDSLLQGLLGKPVAALTLSSGTLMRLWGLGIQTVKDLASWQESRLIHAMRAVEGSYKRKAEVVVLHAVANIKERLAYFDLSLAPERGRGVMASKGFLRDEEEIVNPEILSLQPEMLISEEMAAEKLGPQYALFKKFREAKGDEQILLRNEIATVNYRLPEKFSRGRALQLERRRVAGKIKEEALEEQDLFQEGSMGLLRSVELYDYRRGNMFSTYASQWIKNYISRAITNQLYPVRIPVNMSDSVWQFVRKVDGVMAAWHAENPLQDPTREEVARSIGISVERFKELSTVLQLTNLISLDERVQGDEGEVSTLGDLIPDIRYNPDTIAAESDEQGRVEELTHTLLATPAIKPIDRQCVVLWFGLEGNREHTLDEIGEQFGVTGQRIQQRIAGVLDMLRTQKNWQMARTLMPKIQDPGKIRKTDIVLRDTPHDRITRLERRNEDIAHDILSLIAGEYSIDHEVLRSSPNLGKDLLPIRRHAIGEMYRSAKLSAGFIAFFFNLSMEMAEEEIAIFLAECEDLKRKGNQQSELEWSWKAMQIIVQTAKTDELRPEQLFGPAKAEDDDVLKAARRVAIIRLREEIKLSFQEIADFLRLLPEIVARSFARKNI